MSPRRPTSSLAVVVIALACAAIARADGPILHEYVPDVGDDEGTMLVSSGGAEPAALVYDGEVITAPEGGALRQDERAMQATPGDGSDQEDVGRRSPTFRPDRVTELNGQIGYFEIFTPTISPFKRVTALDGVTLGQGGTPVLAIAERGPRARVEVVGAQAEAPDWRPRDRFWGSVVLDFTGGREVPLPSVSPESRLLTLRTEPVIALHVERDGADNFYAVLDPGITIAGEVRVTFLTDAPRTYFGTDLPTSRADALIAEVPEMPSAVERRALDFAGTLGLARQTPFDEAIRRLTEHFRSFEESHDPPRDTGDIYYDLATGMRGVCRHRAYAFVITAHALGIMARFVQNEAHAWVEVHLPESRGWMRIDLGGSPRGLQAHNADERPAYRPDVPDPLPHPAAYDRAYAEARRMSEERTAAAEGAEASAAGAGEGAGENGEGTTGDGAGAAGTGSPPTAAAGGSEARAPLELSLDMARTIAVLRGRTLEVSGTARTEDVGVEALRIEVLLASERGEHERLLGVTVTNEHGVFRGSFGVPPDLAVGDYRMVVRSPGNQHVGPALAR